MVKLLRKQTYQSNAAKKVIRKTLKKKLHLYELHIEENLFPLDLRTSIVLGIILFDTLEGKLRPYARSKPGLFFCIILAWYIHWVRSTSFIIVFIKV